MQDYEWVEREAMKTLERLMPRLQPLMTHEPNKEIFLTRLQYEFPRLFRLLHELYGQRYDFFYHLEQILMNAVEMFIKRPAELKALDQQREADKLWFQSETMVGGVCYVDLFADDLKGIKKRIPYFKELGLTYVHLMPLFQSPEENSDGGYAISDYRTVNPDLGTMEQLADLAKAFRKEGISLVLDFVFNHTSDEHIWAKRALQGEERYQDFYYMFPDRTMPDAYERTLREIFPDQAPGNFTYRREVDKWVWTSFYDFQWDLNYKNPDVFNAMMGEMLFLANQGVEVLRLDAVAFIWKQLGTSCESLAQAHMIIRAYNAITRIVCPAMLFKSEAIVHPNDVATYIGWEEAPLSYHPTLMALLWEALATRKVELLHASMARRFHLPSDCAWVNYVRVHDDIGWTFADEDAAELWINGYDHRQFLNAFYLGEFDGSFAIGEVFGYNERTGDKRISGTGASLAGVEKAVNANDDLQLELSIKRFLLIHSIILSVGGIPLIYLGDELATLNDYSYKEDPNKKDDSRWVHRSKLDWQRAKKRTDKSTVEGMMFQNLTHMIDIRKSTPAIGQGVTTFFPSHNPHILAFSRAGSFVVLANFSEFEQTIPSHVLDAYSSLGSADSLTDLIADADMTLTDTITLAPYQVMWLQS